MLHYHIIPSVRKCDNRMVSVFCISSWGQLPSNWFGNNYLSIISEYVWKSTDPVQLKDGLNSSLPSFQLNNVTTTYCTSKTNTGTYSCLRTVLELRRQFRLARLFYFHFNLPVVVSFSAEGRSLTAQSHRTNVNIQKYKHMMIINSFISSHVATARLL